MTPRAAHEFARRGERLCRRLAPLDLAGWPVYVVPLSAVPGELGGDTRAGGFTGPLLDLQLRGAIGAGWRGRGPCLVVADADWDLAREVVVHELAHVLTLPRPHYLPTDLPPPVVAEYAREYGGRVNALFTPDGPAVPAALHGPRFERVALHLHRRAARLGMELNGRLVTGGYYRHPDSGHAAYCRTLGDELDRLGDATFADILATPTPAALVALWERDTGERYDPTTEAVR